MAKAKKTEEQDAGNAVVGGTTPAPAGASDLLVDIRARIWCEKDVATQAALHTAEGALADYRNRISSVSAALPSDLLDRLREV